MNVSLHLHDVRIYAALMCRSAVDVVYLVDGSSGIMERPKMANSNSWNEIMYFLNNVTARLDRDHSHVSFVKYSNRENNRVEFFFTKARHVMSDMKISPSRIRYLGGATDTGDALMKVRNEVIRGSNNRNYAPDVVVLLTDGPPSQGDTSPTRLRLHADDLRNAWMPNLKIVVVGVSGSRQTYQNLQIVSDYRDDIIFVNNYPELRGRVEELLRDICPGELTYGEVPTDPVYPPGTGKTL